MSMSAVGCSFRVIVLRSRYEWVGSCLMGEEDELIYFVFVECLFCVVNVQDDDAAVLRRVNFEMACSEYDQSTNYIDICKQ